MAGVVLDFLPKDSGPRSVSQKWRHGTIYAYEYKQCRCEKCKRAGKAYARAKYLRKCEVNRILAERTKAENQLEAFWP